MPHKAVVRDNKWLDREAFEIRLEKPPGFVYQPGQKLACAIEGKRREYSLASAPEERDLALCVKWVPEGEVSPIIAGMSKGDRLAISDAYGFFIHRPGRSVLVATGTGIAPFVSYAKSGVRDFILLHGVRRRRELYYRELMQRSASKYIACLSDEGDEGSRRDDTFAGRVTEYLEYRLDPGDYDFYFCGNGAMVRDGIQLVDRRFPGSRVFTETFYSFRDGGRTLPGK